MVLDASIGPVSNTPLYFSVYSLHALKKYRFRAVVSRAPIKFFLLLIVRSFAKIQAVRNNIEGSRGVSIIVFSQSCVVQC